MAKDMEKAEQDQNFVNVEIMFEAEIEGEEEHKEKTYSFTIHPSKPKTKATNSPSRLAVHFVNMRWVQNKNSKDLKDVCNTILRQICRNYLRDCGFNRIAEECIYFTIKYREQVVFTDEYFVEGEIDMNDLSNCFLDDSNQNDDLSNIQHIFSSYMDMVANMDFGPTCAC